MSVNFLTIPDKRLTASILESAMSFKVSNILGWDGEALESADFGTQAYVVFRNSTNTEMELMEIDPTTIASASITIVRRGLKFDGDRTTEVSANKKLWVKGDTIVSFGSHPPQLLQYLKEYIDGIAIAGSPDASTTAKGISEEATQAELRARTAAGSVARLFVNPSTLPNVLIADYVADTGTADAYAIAPTPAIVAYVTGQRFTFKVGNTNTGTSTLNINSLGNKTIKKNGGAKNLDAGDIVVNQIVEVEYDGTNFQLISPLANTIPVGMIAPFAGSSAPGGWLIANGSAVSRTTYAALFSVLSTTFGTGDGSTTFNLPDLRSRQPIGVGTGTKVATFVSRSSNVITVSGLSNTANNEFQTGQAVLYSAPSGAMTGLTHNTTYYIVRVSNTTFSLATSRANAVAGTVISLSSDGTGTQTFTLTLSAHSLADTGGEEQHSLLVDEIPSHNHAAVISGTGGGGGAGSNTRSSTNLTGNTGGSEDHNNLAPFVALNYIIKY